MTERTVVARTETATLLPEAYAAALAGRGIGPARLAALLATHSPAEAWVVAGGGGGVRDVWEAHRAAGVEVHLRGRGSYPETLADDMQAPAVLFSLGDLAALDRPRVAIVGTRRCTPTGRDVARQLGRELADAGVAVVSGLALGIDGAAHEGALATTGAPPVAVVGSGLDVVYPTKHERLWSEVARRGLLLSEAPLGTRPEAWRFPARNRILAALGQVVVVVESHAAGGSLHTVRAAAQRGLTVMAVPGSVRNPAAAGTNQLLSEGLPPARDTDDVLVALGLANSGAGRPGGDDGRLAIGRRDADRRDPRPAPEGEAATVLAAIGWDPAALDDVLARTALSPGRAAVALSHLEETGWIRRSGGWYERLAAP